MNALLKPALALTLVSFLAACGGGGSDGGIETSNKYAGTHSYCDGDHTRYKIVLTGTGNSNYNTSVSEITYQNANCTGSVLATYSEIMPTTFTFVETGIAAVRSPNLPTSLTLDKYKANVPNTTATLTGTGVDGSCVNYPGGRLCYDLTLAAEQIDFGAYSTSTGFYILPLENGTYVNDEGYLFVKE